MFFKIFIVISALWNVFVDSSPIIYGASLLNSGQSSIYDNVIEIRSDREVLLIFGSELDQIRSLELSLVSNEYGKDCNDDRIPHNLIISEVSQNGSLARVNFTTSILYPFGEELCFCTRTIGVPNSWIHQGNASVVRLAYVPPPLPVWGSVLILVVLLTFSGFFSGLNLGLMALTPRELELIKVSGSEREKKYAEKILPIRKKGNVLLCSILFGVTIFNASATVIIDQLTTSVTAVVISTVAIVLFAELLPQSICSKFGLAISAKAAVLIDILLLLTWPFSYPLGKILDWALGHQTPTSYNRQQLLEVFRLNKEGNLEKDEFDIIFGGLKLKSKTADLIMTPLNNCFMINENSILNFETVSDIIKSGFSRIPVYKDEATNITGILFLKDITFVETDDMVPLKKILKFYNHPVIKVTHDTTLDVLLKEFKKGISHMAIVVKSEPNSITKIHEAVGIITLEDIIEEIIQSEIEDEKDCDRTKDRKTYDNKNATHAGLLVPKRDFSKYKCGEELTENMTSTLCQFMSTSIVCFLPKFISFDILKKLVTHKGIVVNIKAEGNNTYLYQKNVPADYFILIIEGKVEVTVGTEKHTYTEGSFSYFGQTCLDPGFSANPNNNNTEISNKFTPDFTVRVIDNALILRIPSSYYNIAVRSTMLRSLKEKGDADKTDFIKIEFPDFPTNKM